MNWADRRERLRTILKGGTCYYPGSVFDPLSARAAESVGFEVGMLAGSVASLAVLGAPDLIVLTLSEFAGLALRINRATTNPVLADADHGYGNALNVMRTVQELELAGISGLTIEDTLLPRPFGQDKVTPVSLEEGVGKIRAALAARSDPGLVVVARTGAMAMTGLEDTLARIRAYDACGADAIFLTGVQSRSELEAAHAATALPLILGTLVPALDDCAYLASQGVRIALQGHAPFMAAVEAAYRTLAALRAGTKPRDLAGQPSADRMQTLSHDETYRRAIRSFLT